MAVVDSDGETRDGGLRTGDCKDEGRRERKFFPFLFFRLVGVSVCSTRLPSPSVFLRHPRRLKEIASSQVGFF